MVIWMLCASILWNSCSTITPKENEGRMYSFDGSDYTSGIIGKVYDSDNKHVVGYEITKFRVDNYNSLISKYGSFYDPPLKSNEGLKQISEGRFIIDNQHMVYHLDMIDFKHNGKTVLGRSLIETIKDKIQ